jgi:membrane complex biogenesis BtpA family protein
MELKKLFNNQHPVIGMVHLLPLPGSPNFQGNITEIYERALWEANILANNGIDGLIVENFGDVPYKIGEPLPEQISLMAAITREISRLISIPLGVNVQFNAWKEEIAIAYTCGASFVRVEVFVDSVVSAQGMVYPCSAEIMRYRKQLGAQGVYLWADIQTKYTTNLIPQSLSQSATDAHNAGADALIVTGTATGQATPLDSVNEVKEVCDLPVLVGSGTNIKNVAQTLKVADGVIIGSALKVGGKAENTVSENSVKEFIKVVHGG